MISDVSEIRRNKTQQTELIRNTICLHDKNLILYLTDDDVLIVAVSESTSVTRDISEANRCGYHKAHSSVSVSRSVGPGHSELIISTT